ncbi:transposase [Lactiplantibacillus plantarum]
MPTRYDKEFKQNIINLYKQGESAAQLAREYGIGYSTVHKWIQGQAKTQSGKSPDEIKAMEKRLASLSEENEILKKAITTRQLRCAESSVFPELSIIVIDPQSLQNAGPKMRT